jgi:ubiquinone/menaquinone biosynthesis C-methylase UbiE
MSKEPRPEPGGSRADGLSAPARQVHLAVLAAFARTGQPPARAELGRLAASHDADPDAVLEELARSDALAFAADGEIRAAYPFSPAATAIRVTWPEGPAAYAMCAIDALGMSAMLGRPVTITATEPGTSRVITVHADGDQARWDPPTTVVFDGSAGDAHRPSADCSCSYINFFATARNARAWARRHPGVTGRLLTREAALRLGIAQFGALLRAAPRQGDQAAMSREQPAKAGPARRPGRVSNPVFARVFPRLSQAMEAGGMSARRETLLAGLTGQVIEIGAGTGASFGHYPPSVDRVTAVEPEPRLRRIAAAAARAAPVPVTVTDGLASALPAADASFDAAVVTFVLCTVPDQDAALLEICRVLKPGGLLCFLEHVRADTGGLARLQRVLDATAWPYLFGGCHLGRDTTAAIERVGFTIRGLDRFLFPEARTPVSFHITGEAASPGQ